MYSGFMNTTGFPSPAQDYEEKTIDFNALLLSHPASTFVMRYDGNAIEEFQLAKGDLLCVDCSLKPSKNSLAIIRHEGHFICRPLFLSTKKKLYFQWEGKNHLCTEVFGLVTAIVRVFKKGQSKSEVEQ